jgi:hypothetical protein
MLNTKIAFRGLERNTWLSSALASGGLMQNGSCQ